jgi:sialate O-acetylesterase
MRNGKLIGEKHLGERSKAEMKNAGESRSFGGRARTAAVLCLLVYALNCWADPVLPTLFTDHMVLQQSREIHVWGKADAGEKITASLAGHTATTTADAHGAWSIGLPALSAGGPFTLVISGKKQVVIKDVMVGEVWIASGQSNMTFSLDGSDGAAVEVPQANYPQIRLFTVPKKIAVSPQENTPPAHWQLCTPDSAKSFSAVAYYFAREIHRKLNVPVGIIESAWPGTPIEQWIAPDVLRADADTKPAVDEWDKATPAAKSFAENSLPLELEFDDFELLPASPNSPGKMLANFDDGTSRLSTGGSFSYAWDDASDTIFDLVSPGHAGDAYAARITGQLDGTQDSILTAKYKLDGSALDLSAYSGIRFWVRGNGSFRFRSLQPTITDYDDYGAPVMKASAEWQPVTILFRDLRQEGWGVWLPFTQNALAGFTIQSLTTLGYAPMPVSSLYEGMMTPLLPYAFRGALWYQGESNALKAHQYRKLLPALIQNWRDASHQKDMEFLIVQLPNHGAVPDQPGESAWAELREAQFLTLKQVPHTGLAVTIDVGDPKDLHPHRKREVGERLALWALGTTYKQPIEYSGPLYESMQIEGSEARVHFTHVGSALEARGDAELRGFAIAGADRKFHWAQARIEGNTVIVSSREVPDPVAVRYAWGDSPPCNLFNKDGLPASPFRTDDWPGITGSH